MLDNPNPYYWRDPKYPRDIYEYFIQSHHVYKNGRTVPGKYKYDYQFLWPVPIRLIILKNAFPWLLEKDKWGDMELGDAWIRELEKKGIKGMVEDLREYWGPNRHLGWDWRYAVGQFSLTDDQLAKFWGNFKSFSEITKRDDFRIYFIPERTVWYKQIFKEKKISSLLQLFSLEIFDNFPQYLKDYLSREGKKGYVWNFSQLKISQEVGFLPKPL